MKKTFVIIFTLYIFYRRVHTFPDRWLVKYDTSSLKSEELQYFHAINQTVTRNARSIFVTEASESDGKIFFPDNEPKISLNPISPNKPIGPVLPCHNSTFCEYVPHYPTEFVKNAIRTRGDLRYLATINESTEIDERIASSPTKPLAADSYNDDVLCRVREKVVYPKSAENKHKQWVFVVNDDEFPQGVRIETCISDNGPCQIIDGFAAGYKTSCRQKYIYRQLAAINSDGTITPDLFRFPSSCCCNVKFIGNPLTRMNTGVTLDRESSSIINQEQ